MRGVVEDYRAAADRAASLGDIPSALMLEKAADHHQERIAMLITEPVDPETADALGGEDVRLCDLGVPRWARYALLQRKVKEDWQV